MKRKESIGCNMEAVLCIVAAAKGEMKVLVGGFRHDILGLNAGIRHNVEQSLLVVRNRSKEMFDRGEKALLQGLHDALCHAARGVQKSYVDATEVVSRGLS